MPTLKLHYDGWIALPAGLREALGLSSGDRIEAELVDGAVRLRPAAKARRAPRSTEAGAPAPDVPPSAAGPEGTVRGRRAAGRAVDGGVATPKRRGRPPKAVTVQPTVSRHPLAGIGPARLVKKAELEARAAPEAIAAPAPAARVRPERPSQAVERRPFGNVEIRPLGPGRGHNRPRRLPPGPAA